MLRTSRCFVGTFLQFGGPDAIFGAVWNPYQFSLPEFSEADFIGLKKICSLVCLPQRRIICKFGLKIFAIVLRTVWFTVSQTTAGPNPGTLTMKPAVTS